MLMEQEQQEQAAMVLKDGFEETPPKKGMVVRIPE
jgi:hypothetical protein